VDTTIAIYIFTFANILAALYTTYESMFKAFQKMFFSSASLIFSGGLLLIVVCMCAMRHAGIIAYSSASLIVGVFTAVLLAVMVRYFLKLRMGNFSLKLCKYIFVESIPFGVANVFVIIFMQMDTVMLSKMTNASVVGNYNVAYKIIFAMMFFHTAYMISVYPAISKAFKESRGDLITTFEKTVKYFIILGLFTAIFVTFRANDIIHILYGDKYLLGVSALRCLIWCYPFILLSTITADTLNSMNMTRVNMVFAALAAVLNIGLNLILIPRLSLIGAGIATIITDIFVFVGAYIVLSRYLVRINFVAISYKTVIASAVLALILIATMKLNLFIAGILALLVYLLVLILLKSFTKGEYEILKSFFIRDAGRAV
ncbi:flippase, partial [Candidatus Auribacterota bacterium]